MIRITMKNGHTIDIELDEKAAPITCENFRKLVGQGFYDGVIFHRVISGFMIQATPSAISAASSAWPGP